MRRLATELGVAPGALYYHIKSKQELLASLASRMLSDIYFQGSTPSTALLFGCSQLFVQLCQVRESAEVIRMALAMHPDELSFIKEAKELFTKLQRENFLAPDEAVPVAVADGQHNTSELAACSLLHLCVSLIEEEQTRALLAARDVPAEPPSSYLHAVQALMKGWEQGSQCAPLLGESTRTVYTYFLRQL